MLVPDCLDEMAWIRLRERQIGATSHAARFMATVSPRDSPYRHHIISIAPISSAYNSFDDPIMVAYLRGTKLEDAMVNLESWLTGRRGISEHTQIGRDQVLYTIDLSLAA